MTCMASLHGIEQLRTFCTVSGSGQTETAAAVPAQRVIWASLTPLHWLALVAALDLVVIATSRSLRVFP